MNVLARQEKHPSIRQEYENLSLAYLRLADQADRNSEMAALHKSPPPIGGGDSGPEPE